MTESLPPTAQLLLAGGDVIVVQSEYMRVSSVSSNTLTVGRAFGGTSAAAHSTGVTVTSTASLFVHVFESDTVSV